jgi:hypothetical protein
VLSADHSCRAAVARLIAHRIARGLKPCSPRTGAYCQARTRLPETFFADLARQTGRTLDEGADQRWLWKRRRVHVYDGSSVTMPDTPANQAAYPQPVAQKPGLGFPLARIAAVFSLACGAILEVGICRYAGKGRASWGCCTPSGTCSEAATSCWPTGSCARGPREIWAHVRAYNLIRTIMAQAATVGARR